MKYIKLGLIYLLMAFMRLLAPLPLPVVRTLGAGLGALLWLLARRRRHIADVNLCLCFPEWSDAVRRRAVWRHFIFMGQALLDRAWLWHAPEAVLRQRLTWQGPVQALTDPGALVMFAPHFVGLDAGGMATLMLFRPWPVAFISVAQSSPVLERWVRKGRGRMGNSRPYFRHEGMRKILAGLRRGEPLHLSPDMDFNREESIFVPFMGVQAATVPSLSRLARVAGARMVPVVTRLTPKGYAIEVHPPLENFPSEDLVADTARTNELLAGYIRTMPEQYYWVHRRFKTRPEGEPGVY